MEKALALIICVFFLLQPVLTLADNQDILSVSAILGATYPSWFNPEEDPWSPVVWYPEECYDFTIVWNGLTNITEVKMEFDSQNYTVTQKIWSDDPEGYEYVFRICDLTLGNHTYKWYGENIGGNWNSTGYYLYQLVSPCEEGDLTCETLYQSGVGTGMFISGFGNPLFNFLLILGIIGMVLVIFYGITIVFHKEEPIVPMFRQE